MSREIDVKSLGGVIRYENGGMNDGNIHNRSILINMEDCTIEEDVLGELDMNA